MVCKLDTQTHRQAGRDNEPAASASVVVVALVWLDVGGKVTASIAPLRTRRQTFDASFCFFLFTPIWSSSSSSSRFLSDFLLPLWSGRYRSPGTCCLSENSLSEGRPAAWSELATSNCNKHTTMICFDVCNLFVC